MSVSVNFGQMPFAYELGGISKRIRSKLTRIGYEGRIGHDIYSLATELTYLIRHLTRKNYIPIF